LIDSAGVRSKIDFDSASDRLQVGVGGRDTDKQLAPRRLGRVLFADVGAGRLPAVANESRRLRPEQRRRAPIARAEHDQLDHAERIRAAVAFARVLHDTPARHQRQVRGVGHPRAGGRAAAGEQHDRQGDNT